MPISRRRSRQGICPEGGQISCRRRKVVVHRQPRSSSGALNGQLVCRQAAKGLDAGQISQIPGGAEGLDQLVCDGKTLRGSAVETEDGSHRFVAQVRVYARALGVALAQTTYDTGESSERAALKELLSTLELEGVLIQADALHTTRPFFSGAWSRGPTCS